MTVRVAMVGCGWWPTRVLLPALAAEPGARIAALVDPDPARLAATAAAFAVPRAATFASVEAALERVELDAAIVAVPHALHHPVARAVLDRGLHLLLEKPMTIEPAHAHELVALAAARGVHLLVDYPYNLNAQARVLRAAVAAGRIGRIEGVSGLYASTVRALYAGDPEPLRETFGYPVNAPRRDTYSDPALAGGGQGQTQVTHLAALLLWITGLRLRRVAAFQCGFELPVDLVDAIALEFDGGAAGTIASAGGVLAGQREVVRLELFGDAGHVLFDVNEGVATIHGPGGAVERLSAPAPAQRNPEPAPVPHFVAVAAGRADSELPGEIGAAAVELVAATYRAAAERRVVDVRELRP